MVDQKSDVESWTYSKIMFQVSENPDVAKQQIADMAGAFGHNSTPKVEIEQIQGGKYHVVDIPIIGNPMKQDEVLTIANNLGYSDANAFGDGQNNAQSTQALSLK